MAAEQKIKIK